MKAYNTTTGYIIEISGEAYEMSDNADMPNGVNMYLGNIDFQVFGKETALCDLPDGTKRAILQRAAQLLELTD